MRVGTFPKVRETISSNYSPAFFSLNTHKHPQFQPQLSWFLTKAQANNKGPPLSGPPKWGGSPKGTSTQLNSTQPRAPETRIFSEELREAHEAQEAKGWALGDPGPQQRPAQLPQQFPDHPSGIGGGKGGGSPGLTRGFLGGS